MVLVMFCPPMADSMTSSTSPIINPWRAMASRSILMSVK
jgi:hypothetical protein